MFILDTAQDPFDIFSWQSFVAMNWPEGETGEPANQQIGSLPDAARVWFRYETPQALFDPDYVDPVCNHEPEDDKPVLRTGKFLQSSGYPLIDNNLNYVVYDLRINPMMADYIRSNGLDTLEGQRAFADSGQMIGFPMGYYDDPLQKTGGVPGSAALKSAWKILDIESGDDPSRYYTMSGRIAVAAEHSETGEAFCLEAQLALVGMHIMQRNRSGNGKDWTWSTFEHVDNAPDATNARKPIDTLHETLFEGGCQGPQQLDQEYAFYKSGCENCATNHLESAEWKWSPRKPYAAHHANAAGTGSQVVRCWKIFEGTQLVNSVWQEKLQGTVWANYQAASAQWKGANKGMMFPEGEVPRYLTNTTMETYEQTGIEQFLPRMPCEREDRCGSGRQLQLFAVPGQSLSVVEVGCIGIVWKIGSRRRQSRRWATITAATGSFSSAFRVNIGVFEVTCSKCHPRPLCTGREISPGASRRRTASSSVTRRLIPRTPPLSRVRMSSEWRLTRVSKFSVVADSNSDSMRCFAPGPWRISKCATSRMLRRRMRSRTRTRWTPN